MPEPLYTLNYDVNTIVLDSNKRLGLFGLLNLLQDAAWLHAKSLGWGFDDLISKGTIWALVRQKLVMSDWPAWEDKVTIRTWGRPVQSALALREFEVLVGGRKLGECTTSWLVLDRQTRRPVKLDRIHFDMLCRKEGLLSIEAQKIMPRRDLQSIATFQVRNSDLDVNGHVNNTRYAQWILDTMSLDELAHRRITEYEVNFLSETGVGDSIVIESNGEEPEGGLAHRHYQGRRASEDKPAFVARLVMTAA